MKRCLILIVIAVFLFPAASASETLSVAAKGAVLIDGTSGRVLFRQNADEMLPMASTTKIMTALIALESCSLDETVVAGKNAAGVEGTSIYLSEGESLSMEHMLYGLMLRSGNDAAVAIAEHVSGSVPAFVEKMNARAQVLNADAHFVNPNGLPASGHAASALGMARIMRAAMQIDEFRTITATERKIIPWVGNEFSRVLENKNRLLSTYDGANGGKTGYTKTAGRRPVFSAERDGLFLIGAVLNCPTWSLTPRRRCWIMGLRIFECRNRSRAGSPSAKSPFSAAQAARCASLQAKRFRLRFPSARAPFCVTITTKTSPPLFERAMLSAPRG